MNKPQVTSDHYRQRYDDRGRFLSYWHQIDEVLKLKPEKILEIGIGTSMVSDYLKKRRLNIVTIDIDPALKPDCVASILQLPVKDCSFDTVVCCQVLEHIPFENFLKAISELKRVSQKNVLISLPNRMMHLHLNFKLYPLIQKGISVTLPQLISVKHEFDGEHYWEIGKKGYPLRKIRAMLKTNSLVLSKEFRVPEKPLHHFFLLKKNNKSVGGRE